MGNARCLARFALATLICASVSRTAAAAECTTAEMLRSATSVIEPCTQLLADRKLDKTKRAEALLVRGRGFHRSRRLEQAAQDYEAATKLAPGNAEIWLSWSNVELRRGNMRGYIAKLQHAGDIAPNNARVLRYIGQMFMIFGEQAKAIDLYNNALQIDPTEPFALLFRSQLYQSQQKFAEAMADADALIALPRESINRDGYLDENGETRDFHQVALIHRGWLFAAVGHNDRAKRDFDAAVADGRTPYTLTAAANFLISLSDDPAEPAALLEEAVRKEPGNASAQFALGLIMLPSRQFEAAFTAFDRAVTARPGFSLALQMRARMHRQFGRTDEAVKDYIAAIDANPGVISDSMPALRHAGYWTSAQVPTQVTPELRDAIRACMLDTACN